MTTGWTDLDEGLAGLPPEVEPGTDLWPGIRSAISRRRLRRRVETWLPLAAVAGLALVVAAGTLLREGLPAGDAPAWSGTGGLSAAVPHAADMEGPVRPVAYGPGYNVGPSFVLARSRLSERAEEVLQQLDPTARQVVERDLAELRRSQAMLNAALSENPDDTHLQRLLMNNYQRELVLLQEVTQLVTDLPRRTDL